MHEHRRDIDGLRALAVVAVVLYHFQIPGFDGGFTGVDVFFVISGFLITRILLRELESGSFSLGAFYERRARRLFPALFTMLACTAAAAVLLLVGDGYDSYATSFPAAAAFVANVHFWRTTNYFEDAASSQPLVHTWSLAVEEQFYLLFPLLLLLLHKALRRTWLVWVLALGGAASLYAAWRVSPLAHKDVFYLPQFRAWELCLGAVVCVAPALAMRRRGLAEVCTAVGIAAIVVSATRLDATSAWPVPTPLVACLGTALVLAFGPGTRGGQLLGTGPLVFVGLVSYSLYLWHWPVWIFARAAMLFPATLTDKLLMLAGSALAATLSYKFVEQPFRGPRGVGTAQQILVASAVCIGLSVTVMPRVLAALTPALPEEALAIFRAGKEVKRVERCRKGTGIDAPNCQLGERRARRTFLLWGDSHAKAISEGLDLAAARAGKHGAVLYGSACAPLLGVTTVGEHGDCAELGEHVLRTLDANEEIDTVFLAARWSLYAPGAVNDDDTRARTRRWLEDDDPATDTTLEVVEAGLARTLRALNERRLRVILLEQVPDVGWLVPRILARARLLERAPPHGPTLTEHRARQRLVSQILARLQPRYAFERVDLAAPLCNAEICRVEVDGLPAYADDDHLSTLGSTWVASRLRLFE